MVRYCRRISWLGVFVVGLTIQSAWADSGNNDDSIAVVAEKPEETSNYNKTGRFLAGEEVVTPAGKRVKVWSTEGPVSVSKSPEPFEDTAEKKVPRGTGIVIDDDYRRTVREPQNRR